MDIKTKDEPPHWRELQHRLEDHLITIHKEESSSVRMASRSLQFARDILHQLHKEMTDYAFRDGEEVQFYKVVKPFFISKVVFYSRLFKIEMDRPPFAAAGLEAYYLNELKRLTSLFDEHRFIHRYIENASTFLDEKLFFKSGPDSTFALSGLEPPADGAFPVCYDHVVGQLLGADLLKRHLLETLEELTLPGHAAGNQPRITWTSSKALLIEIGYTMYAAGVFNNGKGQLKDIFECLETAFHIKVGNYPRTFQEVLYRKSGYTAGQDAMKNDYLLYIQRIEDKHIG
jgi:hypothetical protein